MSATRLNDPVLTRLRQALTGAYVGKLERVVLSRDHPGSRSNASAFPCAIFARSADDTGSASRNARARASGVCLRECVPDPSQSPVTGDQITGHFTSYQTRTTQRASVVPTAAGRRSRR